MVTRYAVQAILGWRARTARGTAGHVGKLENFATKVRSKKKVHAHRVWILNKFEFFAQIIPLILQRLLLRYLPTSLAFVAGAASVFNCTNTQRANEVSVNHTDRSMEVIALGTKADFRFKGLALDLQDSIAYLGSWDKKEIVAVSLSTGRLETLKTNYSGRLNGMGCFLRDGILYAVMNEVDDDPDAGPVAALVMFDVKTGKVVRSYEAIGVNGRNHFNHVVVNSNGIAYISNTLKSSICVVDTKDPLDSINTLIQHNDLSWVHGIDLSADEKLLYTTSYNGGIRFLDLSSATFRPYRDTATAGDDGLRYHRGALYGVGHNAIKKYSLSEDGGEIIRVDTVLKDHPMFNDPRCLHVDGGYLYCLANIELEPVTFRGAARPTRDAPLDDSYLIRIPIE